MRLISPFAILPVLSVVSLDSESLAGSRPAIAPGHSNLLPSPVVEDAEIGPRMLVLWAASQITKGRVLSIGTEAGALELELDRRGIPVVCLESREEAIIRARRAISEAAPGRKPRISFLNRDPLALKRDSGRYDYCVIGDALLRHLHPKLLIQAALEQLRPDGKLIVAITFGESDDPAAIHALSLSSFVELVRPICYVSQLTVSSEAIQFVGVNRPLEPDNWARFSPEWILQTTESAVRLMKRRLNSADRGFRKEKQKLVNSIRYQAGEVLVNVAKNPARAWRLPLDVLRLMRDRGEGGRRMTGAEAAAAYEELPSHVIPRVQPGGYPSVLCILDRFSEFCWRYDGNWVPALYRHWKEQIDSENPDLFFMESVWEGNHGAWRAPPYSDESKQTLSEIIAYCRSRNIPTVFWNKEDPPNFDRFIETALMFDHIFTTDADCIPRYVERAGHNRVYALPFAAQPAIHNPMWLPGYQKFPVCFAGTWFAEKYPDRVKALQTLLEPSLRAGLHIYDRHATEQKDKFKYPQRYVPSIKGSLSYVRMLTAYRAYQVILNVNSAPTSPTMFSRRVFESLACGTPVISSPSVGMSEMLGDIVHVARTTRDTKRHLKQLLNHPEDRERIGHLGYRLVHREHTYAHRLRIVLEKIGKPMEPVLWPKVTVLLSTTRPKFVKQAIDSYTRQTYPSKELKLLLNRESFDLTAIQRMTEHMPDVQVLQFDETYSLGQCLNAGLDLAAGEYIAKMDDDDLYGDEYLWDLVLAARFSGADITGKGVYFAYVTGSDRMGVRRDTREHSFVQRGVAGGTLTVRRGVFDRVRFQSVPRGTDTRFLSDSESEGFNVYSADPYNYVMVCQSDPSQHTWQIDETEVLRRCKRVQRGLDLSRAFI